MEAFAWCLYTVHVRRVSLLITVASLLLTPVVHAADVETWDMRLGTHLPDGAPQLTTVEKIPEGIRIRTNTDGFLFWKTPFVHPVDVMTLHIQTLRPLEAGLLWHPASNTDDQLLYNFDVPAASYIQEYNIVVSMRKQWNWQTSEIAIGIPSGSDIILQDITWTRYSLWEKLQTAWESFWTFDDFRPYSINFLWGPLLAFTPPALDTLYQTLPPTAWSIDRYLYGLIAASMVMGLIFFLFDRNQGKKYAAVCIVLTCSVLWILYDIRMGLELIGYAVTDVQTFILPKEQDKTLRTHGNFYTLAERLAPVLAEYPEYVLYAPENSPYYANMRYMAFPAVPLRPDQDTSRANVWAVISRSDVTFDPTTNRLMLNNQPITPPGRIVLQLDTAALIFTTLP